MMMYMFVCLRDIILDQKSTSGEKHNQAQKVQKFHPSKFNFWVQSLVLNSLHLQSLRKIIFLAQ